MLADPRQIFPVVEATFAEASAELGYDLWASFQNGPEEELNKTRQTQPALLAASVAIWRVWQEKRRHAWHDGRSQPGEYPRWCVPV